MVRSVRPLISLSLLAAAAACATASGASSASANSPTHRRESVGPTVAARSEPSCTECTAIPIPSEITHAVESRIADLMARGGECSRYGSVLETSYRSGQITLRPFMWRVGKHLASGEAKPNGDMTLAREIDSLNVGVRTVSDVIASMEHEAVHITFDLASGNEASEEKANQTVRACKA